MAHTSDPIYWSVIATVLMRTIFQKVKSSMSLQEFGIIDKRIKELEELSNEFISKAYNVDQEKTIEFLKEARIGRYSIIGEF